jgi:ERCC4-related helicase
MYHSKYYATLLTLQNGSGSVNRLSQSMFNAQIDLNPHQIEAALFAFQSPLSNGVILADEVGLGKTIEAGLVLCQYWSEFKRKIIIIAPASLRKQWGMELKEKFFIDSVILEAKSYKEEIKNNNINPFEQKDALVITSYQFAVRHEEEIIMAGYDLAIIDEAHKLRNVYRKENKTAKSIKRALANTKKVLLTATPLQNSLLELYGLTSIVDDQVFGDVNSFKQNYVGSLGAFTDLKERLMPVCHRTLRKDVLEYIKYTKRLPLVEEFTPSAKEQEVYDLISDFLQRDSLFAIPNKQRALITLIMRKLLASSTRAIIGTISTMINRLQASIDNHTAISVVDAILDDESAENYMEEEDVNDNEEVLLSTEDIRQIQNELIELRSFKTLALSIKVDAKLKSLVVALEKGLESQKQLGASEKALIFTESRRTQEYLYEYLTSNGYANKVVLFNGTNTDDNSKIIYKKWLEKHEGSDAITGSCTADKKQAIVDAFKDDSDIMIATEAGAEGINLQFCNLVVNYDLPWNPQRVEQRIGRCHRYGQKNDVVVLNFINTANKADRRVYELLSQKFKLFEGIFGASDEILGSIESGIDFERRILEIYQTCRDLKEIDQAFDDLQENLDDKIQEKMLSTRQQLLDHFDEDVHARLKVRLDESKKQMDKFERAFWKLTQFELNEYAQFSESKGTFFLQKTPAINIPAGNYQLITQYDESANAHAYRINSDLGQYVVNQAKSRELPVSLITFDLSGHDVKVGALEPYIGQSGCAFVTTMIVDSFEREEYIVSSAITDDGIELNDEFTEKLFGLKSASETNAIASDAITLQLQTDNKRQQDIINDNVNIKNNDFFDNEMEKLDNWADDLKISLEVELKALEKEIKTRKTEQRKLADLSQKVAFQRKTVELEKRRNRLRRKLYDEQDAIEEKKEILMDKVAKKLNKETLIQEIFTIQWKII